MSTRPNGINIQTFMTSKTNYQQAKNIEALFCNLMGYKAFVTIRPIAKLPSGGADE